jgi:ABC-type branched-subunit amino acid transport system substrate-binding protein
MEATREALARDGVKIAGYQEYELKTVDFTAHLLGLRRTDPDVLILYGTGAADLGNALKGLQDISWDVPVAGSAFFGTFAPVITRIAGPDAFKNAWGLEVKGVTYCSTDPVGQSDFAKYAKRLKKAEPQNFDKLNPALGAYMYDAIYLLKAAVDGARSTEGPKVAAWIENNASSVKALYGPFVASKTSHFLVPPDVLVPVENLGSRRADGLVKRAGC